MLFIGELQALVMKSEFTRSSLRLLGIASGSLVFDLSLSWPIWGHLRAFLSRERAVYLGQRWPAYCFFVVSGIQRQAGHFFWGVEVELVYFKKVIYDMGYCVLEGRYLGGGSVPASVISTVAVSAVAIGSSSSSVASLVSGFGGGLGGDEV